MPSTQTMPGKKVKLSVYQGDAEVLRQKGKEFFEALQGRTIEPDGRVVFGEVMLMVEATKPKGPVEIGGQTAIKMAISKKPIALACPHCGREQAQPQSLCPGCGQQLPLVQI